MRVFVTGASGWVGSAVIPELLAAGHRVTGLAGVIHLAYRHDIAFAGDPAAAATSDVLAIETIGSVLEDRTGRSSSLQGWPGSPSVASPRSRTLPPPGGQAVNVPSRPTSRGNWPRMVSGRPSCGSPPPSMVEATPDSSLRCSRPPAILASPGTSAMGRIDGPQFHRADAAHLFRLALESAPAGSVLHGVDDTGVALRDVADVIGRHLDIPVRSIPTEEATNHFGWLGSLLSGDFPASSTITRKLLAWQPTHSNLLEDLDQGHCFR